MLKTGTISVQQIEGTANGTITSSGLELTTSCKVESETLHCIYATENTKFGTLNGGNPAIWQISAVIPALPTSPACGESGELVAEYEITAPKPLYVEPAAEPASALLCTEAANPCASHEPSGTVLEAQLASGSELQFDFGYLHRQELTCPESTIKAEATNTGSSTERIEGKYVRNARNEMITFERCRACENGICFKEACTYTVALEPGGFTIAASESFGDGRMSLEGAEFTFGCLPFSNGHCKFRAQSVTLGKIKGGNPATLEVEATIPLSPGWNAFCESAAISGTYEITSPNPLYIEPG